MSRALADHFAFDHAGLAHDHATTSIHGALHLAIDADIAITLDLALDGGALHDAVDLAGADGFCGLVHGIGFAGFSLRNMVPWVCR